MAASAVALKLWFISIILFYLQTTLCDESTQQAGASAGQSAGFGGNSGASGQSGSHDADPVDIIARALTCFSDQYVYSSCQESYRLNAEGCINVPRTEVDHYCGGPCLIETKLALDCVNHILNDFKFYNGATIADVKYTLNTGCSHGNNRGNFNVQQRLGQGGEEGDYNYHYGDAHKLPSSMSSILTVSLLAACFIF